MSFEINGSEFGTPRLQTWFVLLLLTVVFAVLTSGCILIPTPHYYDTGSRQNVTAQSTNLIQPGWTPSKTCC